MKIVGIVILFLFSNTFSAAQQNNFAAVLSHLSAKAMYVPSHDIIEQSVAINCAFGKADLVIPQGMIDLNTVQITAIDLVFTDYPSTDKLIQLNTTRLQHLFTAFPAVANTAIAWKVIRQMDGAAKDAAVNMFHGFVIYYRPLQNKSTLTTDLVKLKDMLTPKEETGKKRNGFVIGDTSQLRKQYEIEEYTTVLKLPVDQALRYMHIDIKEKATYKNYDSLFVYLKPDRDSLEKITFNPPIDSTVIKVFDRMDWNNMLAVADVTASMYPYTGQLLLWLKMHEEERRIHQFVFFNDGDDKDDDKKTIGNTGGIYSTPSSVFEVVEQLLYQAMSNGNGGNIPENNLEALIKGSQLCSGCSSVIMIADNNSSVSDMALLAQIKKPVHIILCGGHDLINVDYLTIAYNTGGSVHTQDEDVLVSNQITIHGHEYKLVNGKFVVMK